MPMQALLLSMLPDGSHWKTSTAEDAQRSVNGLWPVLKWFRAVFVLLPPEVMEPDMLVQQVEPPSEQVRAIHGA
jgi:hypothetical protein